MDQRRYIFLAVLISSFMCPFLSISVNVAIPAMAAEFGSDATSLSWAVTSFLLGSASVLLPCGRLSDILGRKRVFRTGVAAVAITSFLSGLAPSVELLVACRFLQGLSISMIFVTGMAMLVSANNPKERGRVIGYSIAATYSGLSLGPFLGGLITHYASWRLIFYLSTAILALSWWLCSKITGEWYGNREYGLDYKGSMLYFLSALSIMYGLSVYVSKPIAPILIGGGIAAGMLFMIENRRSAAPLLDFTLFRNVIFAMSNAAAFLHYSATFAISFLMSLYLQVIRGLDEVTAGTILLLQPVMMAALSPAAGRLSDNVEPRIVASTGMAITAIGIFSLSQCSRETDLYMIGAILLFIGIGFAFFSAPNSSAIMGSVSPKEFGIASSIMSMMRIFGQSMSMVLVTLLLSAYVLPASDAGYAASMETGIRKTFTIFSVICTIGVGISLMRGKR